MNHSFIMKYEGLEFVLRKADVDFRHGLGIVTAVIEMDWGDEVTNETLIGVVNPNYESVFGFVPLFLFEQFQVLDEEDVVFITKDHQLYHLKVDQDYIEIFSLLAYEYEYLGSKILKINDGGSEALFSLETDQLISDHFSHIGSFEYREEYGCEVAEASVLFSIDEALVQQIITYINKEGKVISPYYVANQKIYCDESMNISEVIEFVKSLYGMHR